MAIAGLVLSTACSSRLQGASRRAADASDPLILRSHFIGSDALFADATSGRLKAIWSVPGAKAFHTEAVERFSHLPARWLGAGKGTPDNAALFRPLIEDLLANESFAEFRATPEMVIAVRLPDARAKAWDTALRQAFGGWKLGDPAAVTADGLTGWEIKRRQAPQVIRAGRMGEWFVVTAGPEKLSLVPALSATLKARAARASGPWLEGDVNLARCDDVLPALDDFKSLPMAHFSFSNRADFVRTVVVLDFPKAHEWKAEPWRIPTNAIFDPLVSFNAARGIAPFLGAIPAVQQAGWSPTPNQLCGWALRKLPFQFNYATPANDVLRQLHEVAPRLQNVVFTRDRTNLIGRIAETTNYHDVYWQGLPLAVPRLSPLRGNSNFLSFEMFPMAATKERPPAELFQQLSRDNLVYYDWEITEEHLLHWRQFYQLAEIATRRQLSPTNVPSARLINDAAPKLGECVTEMTATSPTQMTIVRKSHMGLSSFELVTLSRWLENTNFPQFGVFLPQQPRRLPARTGAPAPR